MLRVSKCFTILYVLLLSDFILSHVHHFRNYNKRRTLHHCNYFNCNFYLSDWFILSSSGGWRFKVIPFFCKAEAMRGVDAMLRLLLCQFCMRTWSSREERRKNVSGYWRSHKCCMQVMTHNRTDRRLACVWKFICDYLWFIHSLIIPNGTEPNWTELSNECMLMPVFD